MNASWKIEMVNEIAESVMVQFDQVELFRNGF